MSDQEEVYNLLVSTVAKIKNGVHCSLDFIHRFKDDDQRFPWPKLEAMISDMFDTVDNEVEFDVKEKELFAQFIWEQPIEDLNLESLKTFQWSLALDLDTFYVNS